MPMKLGGELFTQEEWQLAYETETMSLNSAEATAKLNWLVLIDEQNPKKTRPPNNTTNETDEETGAPASNKKRKKKASVHEDGDGDADAGDAPSMCTRREYLTRTTNRTTTPRWARL